VTVFSGGTEGVLSPHMTFVLVKRGPETEVASWPQWGRTRRAESWEIGRRGQVNCVSETAQMCVEDLQGKAEGDVESADTNVEVHLVLIKCPLLTSSSIAVAMAAERDVVTNDTYESMARSRYASTVGIALGLGELETADVEVVVSSYGMNKDHAWEGCARASCSSGAELEDSCFRSRHPETSMGHDCKP
jgi:cyanuric acid amidohydrolase